MNSRDIVVEFFETSTIHGIGPCYAHRKNHRGKLWFFWTSASIIFGIYLCVHILLQFSDSPTVTSVSVHYRKHLDLPHLGFCLPRRLPQNWVDKHNVTPALLDYMNAAFTVYNILGRDAFSSDDVWFLEQKYKELKQKSFPCCDNISPLVTRYGVCFMLNATNQTDGERFHQSTTAADRGLSMIIDMQEPDYFAHAYDFTFIDEGIKIFLGHVSEDDVQNSGLEPPDHEPLLIQSGTTAYLGLGSARRVHLEGYSSCISATSLGYGIPYSKRGCDLQCTANASLDLCGCAPIGYGTGKASVKLCEPFDSVTCVKPNITNVKNTTVESCNCQPHCNETQLTTTVSTNLFPSRHSDVQEKVKQQLNLSGDVSGRLIHLVVFYHDVMLTEYTQVVTFTWANAMAGIGGNLGICAGISLLSIVQAVTFLVDWLCYTPSATKVKKIVKTDRVRKTAF